MTGSLLAKARKVAQSAATKIGFQEDIFLETVDGSMLVEIKGLTSKHWMSFDADGSSINSKNAHVTIKEDDLVDLGYPVRNSKGEVDLLKHRIVVPDSTGINKTYVIIEQLPNETLGLIACILGDFDAN